MIVCGNAVDDLVKNVERVASFLSYCVGPFSSLPCEELISHWSIKDVLLKIA